MRKILIVDDERDILDLLKYNLLKEGYSCETASNGKEALEQVEKFNPDLVLLDIMMPELDGIQTCKAIREMDEHKQVFVVFLTARGEEYSELAGFEAGADDYITKPIKPQVLLSRVKAMFKRSSVEDTEELEIGGLIIDKNTYTVNVNGEMLVFPKKEFELLWLLASKPDKVHKRESILSKVWGDEVYVGDRTIDVHIRKIREKIGNERIRTVKGVGYKFELC